MQESIRLVLQSVILATLIFIFSLLVASLLRRFVRGRHFKQLDTEIDFFRNRLRLAVQEGKAKEQADTFRAKPGSIRWEAVEILLLDLVENPSYQEHVRSLFEELGYVEHYLGALEGFDVIGVAAAMDKLGRMRSEKAVPELIGKLKRNNREVVSVAVRSLSTIGAVNALKGILSEFQRFVEQPLVSSKTLKTSLIRFGENGADAMVEFGLAQKDPVVLSTILEVLSEIHSPNALPLAEEGLMHADAEVRANSLKVIELAASQDSGIDVLKVQPLVKDSEWFVRLHAVRAVAALNGREIGRDLMDSLKDENWHVRNAAATALSRLGDDALDLFMHALESEDDYVFGSICEEIQRTGFSSRMIDNLISEHSLTQEKSRKILETMCRKNFCSQLEDYSRAGTDMEIRQAVQELLKSVREA